MAILEISEKFRQGTLSPTALTERYLLAIERLNPSLHAFITVLGDSALAQARRAEKEIRSGQWRGPLHGIPIALKDIVDTAGTRTTAASLLFKDRIPTQDADVVERLKHAGAVILGKQNLHEFAYGGSSVISAFGMVRNPWNLECIAGGSSGGSAAGIAAGLGLGAIGTDTAGSVREPAAQCGVVGLKPTYGRISAKGVIPLSISLDHVGPITRTVSDAAILLQAIEDPDPPAIGGTNPRPEDYLESLQQPTKHLRIGVPRAFFFEDLDPQVSTAMDEALRVIRSMTADVRDIQLEVPLDRTLQSAESYAYHKEWVAKSPDLYDPETLRRILTGARVSPAEYEHARQDLELSRNEIGKAFGQVDLFITAAVPIPAPRIEDLKPFDHNLRPKEIVLLRNTRPINVWGLPAISVPCGFTEAGLPIGLQIVGPHWAEGRVLQLAHAYEQATAWRKRMPPSFVGLGD